MTNPDSAVGTNAGYNGRTSTRAFNDVLSGYSRGILGGWTCAPKTGMTVELGGDGNNRDVAIAEDNAGNRTTINNTSGAPVPITLDASPATGSRYDLIVAYVENPPQGSGSTDVDFTTQVGFIAVKGTASGTPVVPNDTAIRTAITADGATGASAYYVILAQILVGTNVSTIGSGAITQGTTAMLAIMNQIYPVGAIYMSTTSTSPETLFGGSWTQIKDTFLLAAGTTYSAGTTGGEATHKLTTSELPSHNHKDLNWTTDTYHCSLDSGSSGNGIKLSYTGTSINHITGNFRTGYTGSGTAHNNMPPYLAVYTWKRTA